jgi:acryloyl-coenzyme A reductase
MHAIVLEKTGGPEELHYRAVDDPRPGPDEVLVRVGAAGVCGRDLIDRRGGFPAMKLPTILGHEFAGEVIETGAKVSAWSKGDRVANLHRPFCGACSSCLAGESVDCERAWQSFGHSVDGAYAELVVAHERALVKLPDAISFVDAASIGCTAGVALRALRHDARLELGETVLVTGASGGVGAPAVQLARRMGARVIATTSSARKADWLRELGADGVVVTDGERFHERVRELSGGGVDVALELTGSATFDSALRSLKRRGRLVVVGNISTERVQLNLGAVILFAQHLIGSHGFDSRDLEDCFALVEQGELVMHVDRTLPLQRAAEAHRLLADRAVRGRVILTPN